MTQGGLEAGVRLPCVGDGPGDLLVKGCDIGRWAGSNSDGGGAALALVALTHGEVVAGLATGPAPRFVRRFRPAGSHALRRAISATMPIHLFAAAPDYRRNGIARNGFGREIRCQLVVNLGSGWRIAAGSPSRISASRRGGVSAAAGCQSVSCWPVWSAGFSVTGTEVGLLCRNRVHDDPKGSWPVAAISRFMQRFRSATRDSKYLPRRSTIAVGWWFCSLIR
ncbi:hypothetical protein [Nocardia blacklockiae]|uniref:hypothetical protein n=1 Tax=Nocardia blacklockiae TaxID=480036 RepID=UPI0018956CB0|nr:hypothetical protein [Nocardia blacklockiae]MBF6171031.1 hypothetical protein [Nocardia blacklockiae]